MERPYDEEFADRVDRAAESYWLRGMDLGYAKRRALAEATRDEMPRPATRWPIVHFGG